MTDGFAAARDGGQPIPGDDRKIGLTGPGSIQVVCVRQVDARRCVVGGEIHVVLAQGIGQVGGADHRLAAAGRCDRGDRDRAARRIVRLRDPVA